LEVLEKNQLRQGLYRDLHFPYSSEFRLTPSIPGGPLLAPPNRGPHHFLFSPTRPPPSFLCPAEEARPASLSAASRRRRRPPHLPAPRRQSSSSSCVVPEPPASRSSSYVSGNEDTDAEQYERQDPVACPPRGTGGPPAGSTTAHERDDELVRRRHPPRGRAPPRPGSSPPPPTRSWSSRLPRWPPRAATSPVPSSGSRHAAPTRCSTGLAPPRSPPQGRQSTVIRQIYACARRELCAPATGGHPARQERLPTTSPEGQRAGGHQDGVPTPPTHPCSIGTGGYSAPH
jgi:hypothetical protein